MGQAYSAWTAPAPNPEPALPWEAVPGGIRIKTQTWVVPPGDDRSRPSCFGESQARIQERSESERLCSSCLSLGRLTAKHWDAVNKFREITANHHHSVSALLESVRGGCHLCGLLLIAWEQNCSLSQESNGDWVGKAETNSVSLDSEIKLRFQRVQTKIQLTGVEVDEVQITILCGDMLPGMAGQLICTPIDSNLRALPATCHPSANDTNTGSSASFSRIKAWLDICTSSHPACSQADSQPPPLPTRVIAVGQKGSSTCYLVSGENKSGFYATLSHCWGNPANRPLTTTDQTLALRQQGIGDDELPKTFQDAVQVCREIGIEYLWIDSLCIIQEQKSQADWAKEAPSMGFVYGNSTLTICAAAAADSTKGCFKERLGLICWPCPIDLFGQRCYVSRYPTKNEESRGDPGDRDGMPWNSLAKRAWVLQEQVLSRRSVIFSEHRLIWRCPTLSTSEKYPLGIPHAPNITVDNHRIFHCIINGITLFMPKDPKVDIYTCWYRLVEDFTSRRLTYENDKLPAIAGIARRFAATANDSYHGGLWKRDLVLGLLWHSTMLTAGVTTKAARAPSWSWASVNCGVSFSHMLSAGSDAARIPLSPLLDILNVSDPQTHEDHPFGMTSKASLRLSGVLLSVVEDEDEESGLFFPVNGTRYADDIENFIPDVWDLDKPAQTPLFCLPVCVRHDPYYRGMRGNGELYKSSWENSLQTGMDEFKRFNTLFCLVLRAIEGEQDTYSRVGACVIGKHKTIEISRKCLGERRPLTII
ncbi:heterokaryon incompatibility protein-domain-containing protein [Clohesyomyces aquaticus]|uniref:Heterokaryon incompatibility protein-domain-containing protein n=1 Tax=Clohesyomyces aquaticus TaxID=1231657 RepID=A0A1Y1ZEI4_9PLEO|nr:heterokaryon incompatibility protein-domain-containing protein [Clohesyomyces aquaticus]